MTDLMNNAPEDTGAVLKEAARAQRPDKAEALLATNPPAEFTPQDQADLEKLHGSSQLPPELDDRQAKIQVARETAAQAMDKIETENPAPGSSQEKQIIDDMRAARRGGGAIDGIVQTTTEPETHSTITNTPGTPVQPEASVPKNKWSWRHPFGGGEK